MSRRTALISRRVASLEGGPSRMPGSPRPLAAIAALVCVAIAAIVLATHPTPTPAAAYGQIPSWLPKPKVVVGRIVRASRARPWVAIEGDSVSVILPRGHALVTAVGPVVPDEGTFPVPATTPCSFTVTLRGGAGAVPLSASAFTIVDELGAVHRPRVTTVRGGPLPELLAPGSTLMLTVSGVLPRGSGRLRWAPLGGRPIVSWDFDVEID
jgi:hypothetical protein